MASLHIKFDVHIYTPYSNFYNDERCISLLLLQQRPRRPDAPSIHTTVATIVALVATKEPTTKLSASLVKVSWTNTATTTTDLWCRTPKVTSTKTPPVTTPRTKLSIRMRSEGKNDEDSSSDYHPTDEDSDKMSGT